MPGSTALNAGLNQLAVATWNDPRVGTYRLANGQRGACARTGIPAGQIIGVFGGVPVLYPRAADGTISDPDAAQQAIQVAADDRFVYALVPPPGVPWRGIDYVNHSCRPNLVVRNQVVLVTARDIAAGEPLEADYRSWDLVHYGERCWCDPPRCVI
jgi:hypothetical protein